VRIAYLLFSFTAYLNAQTTGAITGNVKDANGGALSGAQVAARHLETGFTRSSLSGEDGRFVFPVMPVGAYEIRIELSGFRPLLRKGITGK